MRIRLVLAAATLIFCFQGQGLFAADVATVTHGDEVDLRQHLVKGKYVLFDFYADWCGPCRALEPTLMSLASQHQSKLALRKVDVVNWSSPVAKQFRIGSIPHLKLFGPDGALIAEGGAGRVLQALESSLGRGAVRDARPARDSAPVDSGTSLVPFFTFVGVIALVAYLLFFKGKKPAPVLQTVSEAPQHERTPPSTGDASWFVMMQGSLNGPFTMDDLHDLKRRKCIDENAQVRRKGDTDWSRYGDL